MKPVKRSREDLPKKGYAAKPLMDVEPPWNPPRRLVYIKLLSLANASRRSLTNVFGLILDFELHMHSLVFSEVLYIN